MRYLPASLLWFALSFSFISGAQAHGLNLDLSGGKPATQSTTQSNEDFKAHLNFQDKVAFEDNNKGLIAPLDKETGDIIRNSFGFIPPTRPTRHLLQ